MVITSISLLLTSLLGLAMHCIECNNVFYGSIVYILWQYDCHYCITSISLLLTSLLRLAMHCIACNTIFYGSIVYILWQYNCQYYITNISLLLTSLLRLASLLLFLYSRVTLCTPERFCPKVAFALFRSCLSVFFLPFHYQTFLCLFNFC